jgi:hypothetical protein
LQACVVVQCAFAGSSIGKSKPLVQGRKVIELGKGTEASILGCRARGKDQDCCLG